MEASDGTKAVGGRWEPRGLKLRRSALKHGCTPDDIAVVSAWQRTRVSEEPTKWLYVGVDVATRPLEIVTVEGDDGEEVVIHAMKLRKKHNPGGGRHEL